MGVGGVENYININKRGGINQGDGKKLEVFTRNS